VGAAAALVFLEMNGVDLDVPENALVETVLSVAQGQMGKAAVSEFFRKHAKE
jgi:death-on-curing protein